MNGRTASRLLSVLAILSASVASGFLLLPTPFSDVFFTGIILLNVIFALIGGIGAWTNRTPLVWVAAFLLASVTILGMMSVGLFLAPAALFLLGAAVCSQLAGPRADLQKTIIANPPTATEVVLKTLTGTVFMVAGAGIVYTGAFRQELFGACASETVACVLEKTYWDAVGITVLGLTALSLGGWLTWRQIYISWVFASTQTE